MGVHYAKENPLGCACGCDVWYAYDRLHKQRKNKLARFAEIRRNDEQGELCSRGQLGCVGHD